MLLIVLDDVNDWVGYLEDYAGAYERRAVDVETSDLRRPELFDWEALELADELMPGHQVATWACEQLLRDSDEPLFLAVGLQTPHLPWLVPEEYFAMHPRESIQLPEVRDGDRDDLPGAGRKRTGGEGMHRGLVKQGLWPQAVQAYLASISFSDSQVGRLLDALERSPRSDRTVVVLTSDHGFHLGEKSLTGASSHCGRSQPTCRS